MRTRAAVPEGANRGAVSTCLATRHRMRRVAERPRRCQHRALVAQASALRNALPCCAVPRGGAGARRHTRAARGAAPCCRVAAPLRAHGRLRNGAGEAYRMCACACLGARALQALVRARRTPRPREVPKEGAEGRRNGRGRGTGRPARAAQPPRVCPRARPRNPPAHPGRRRRAPRSPASPPRARARVRAPSWAASSCGAWWPCASRARTSPRARSRAPRTAS